MRTKPPRHLRRLTTRHGQHLVPMMAIRQLARQIVERFQPDQIILFGSYAYGAPNQHSDVDLLVVMPARDEISQAVRIRQATDHPFPLDLIVRTPTKLSGRLEEGDWFLREIMERGKVLYAKAHRRVGAQGGGRLARRSEDAGSKTRHH